MRTNVLSDAAELMALKAVGAKEFVTDTGAKFFAIYDAAFNLALVGPQLEGIFPALTCRTVDIEAHGIRKDTVVRRDDLQGKVVRIVPTDDGGQSVLLLGK